MRLGSAFHACHLLLRLRVLKGHGAITHDPWLQGVGLAIFVLGLGLAVWALGTAIAASLYWLIAVVLLGGYFLYSAVMEERFMAKQFPDAYPPYRHRTKMLIPFVV